MRTLEVGLDAFEVFMSWGTRGRKLWLKSDELWCQTAQEWIYDC